MRKLAALVLVATALALTGCSSDTSGYMATIREERASLLDDLTEENLVNIGNAVCAALDDGLSGHAAASELEASGLGLADAGTIVLAASDHLCPQHAADVN